MEGAGALCATDGGVADAQVIWRRCSANSARLRATAACPGAKADTSEPLHIEFRWAPDALGAWCEGARQWTAVSGRDGFQAAEHQALKDAGPLPEGTWLARQSRFERMGVYGSVAGWTGRGTWPGATASWGRFRVWLEPVGSTATYERSGFSIHGGINAGSAGCVDLTQNIDEFARYFLAYGRDLQLVVTYVTSKAPSS